VGVKAGTMCFRVSGEGLTGILRAWWVEGKYLRAIRLLMDCLHGMTWKTAIAILEGRMKLVGEDPNVRAVPDKQKGLKTFDEVLKRQELDFNDGPYGREARQYAADVARRLEYRDGRPHNMGLDLSESESDRLLAAEGLPPGVPEGLAARLNPEAVAQGRAWLAAQEPPTDLKPDEKLISPTGYLLPDGKLYPCPHYGHIALAEALGKTQHEAEKAGWIKLQQGWFMPPFESIEPTQAQLDTMFEWSRKQGVPIPEWTKR